ncbi:MAG: biotin/lipoyl-binding protein, partial [Alphaproteobacteria bacterium]
MTIEVKVPTLGESVTEASVATWFKKPGEAVAEGEMLCELETDKVTVEVPAPVSGVLASVLAPEGATVTPGQVLAEIREGAAAEAAPAAPAATEAATASEAPAAPAGTTAPASGEGEEVEVKVPTLGESVTEATLASWFKAEGEAVAEGDILCELETDKVTVEVPAPAAGVLVRRLAAEGATVTPGAPLALIQTGAGAAAAAAPAATAEAPAAAPEAAPAPARRADVEDAPSARRLMEEHGLSRDQVQGTGRDGRIMK